MIALHKLTIKKATTSKRVQIFIGDSSVTTGAGLTGLVFNTASLVAYYIRDGDAAATAITLATATVGTWASGGFKEISSSNMPGWYELDLPDAVIATGTNHATVHLKGAANMRPVAIDIDLVSYDPNDAVRAGLTALPNANAAAAGGLMTCTSANVLPAAAIVAASFGAGAIDATSIAADAIGSSEMASDFADAVTVEAGINLRQAIALILSKLCGKRSGMATATNTYKGADNTTSRIVETTDSDGNCTASTLTPPA